MRRVENSLHALLHGALGSPIPIDQSPLCRVPLALAVIDFGRLLNSPLVFPSQPDFQTH